MIRFTQSALGGALLAALALSASPAHAYKFFTGATDDSNVVRERQWEDPVGVSYRIHTDSPEGISESEWIDAVEASFDAWNDVEGATIEFVSDGTFDGEHELGDGINQVVTQTEGSFVGGSSVLGIAQSLIFSSGPDQGFIAETDILINGVDFTWSVDGEAVGEEETYDLLGTLTHEVGHMAGLDHSTINAATMYFVDNPVGAGGNPGNVRRSLTTDDKTGLLALYPAEPQGGAITGTITTPGENPGHVVGAVNMAGGDTVTVFTRTRVANDNQEYLIEQLEPGYYIVFTKPLGTDTLSAGLSAFRDSANFDTNFLPRFYSDEQAEGVTDPDDATVLPVAEGQTVEASISPPVGTVDERLILAWNDADGFAMVGAYVDDTPADLRLAYQHDGVVDYTPVVLGGDATMTPLDFLGMAFPDDRLIYGSTIEFDVARANTVRTLAILFGEDDVTIKPGIVEVAFELNFDPPDPPDPPDDPEDEPDLWMIHD